MSEEQAGFIGSAEPIHQLGEKNGLYFFGALYLNRPNGNFFINR